MPVVSPTPAPLPPPDKIHDMAVKILGRRAYELDSPEDVTDQFALKVIRWIGRMLDRIADFFDWLHGVSTLLYWLTVLGLLTVVVALVVHIVFTFVAAVRRPRSPKWNPQAAVQETPEDWERRAGFCMERGDIVGAIRALLRACLLRIEPTQKRPMRRGATNREWLSRARNTPLFEPLEQIVRMVDDRWFGDRPCAHGDFEICQSAHVRIRALVEPGTPSHAK